MSPCMKTNIHPLSENVNTRLVDRLREIAESAGSVSELARRSGVADQTIRNYITRGSSPPAEVLEKLAAAGGVSISWLISGAGPRTPPGEPSIEEVGELSSLLAETFEEEGIEVSPQRREQFATALARFQKRHGRLPEKDELGLPRAEPPREMDMPFDPDAMRAAVRAVIAVHPGPDAAWAAEQTLNLYMRLLEMRRLGQLPRGPKAILDAALREARRALRQARSAGY